MTHIFYDIICDSVDEYWGAVYNSNYRFILTKYNDNDIGAWIYFTGVIE